MDNTRSFYLPDGGSIPSGPATYTLQYRTTYGIFLVSTPAFSEQSARDWLVDQFQFENELLEIISVIRT